MKLNIYLKKALIIKKEKKFNKNIEIKVKCDKKIHKYNKKLFRR